MFVVITYCIILAVVNVLVLAAAEGGDRFEGIVNIALYLPIFGRIFGWW